MYKYNASQSNALQDKLGFRSVPMYLMYYGGKLVSASNALRSTAEVRSAAQHALTLGRKGEFLPAGFSFEGRDDNALLDCIKTDMSLLRGLSA